VAELALRLPPCPSFSLSTEGFHHLLAAGVDVLHPPNDAPLNSSRLTALPVRIFLSPKSFRVNKGERARPLLTVSALQAA
jgi:hypothetical protein